MKKIWVFLASMALSAVFLTSLTSVAEARPCVCAKIYKPVCARKGKSVKTYGNACEARCARARVCAKGPCRCPQFRLVKPKPGCKYVWTWRGCCRYPKLICKRPRRPFCTKVRCKLCNKKCQLRKRACLRKARRLTLRDVARIRSMCKRIRTKSRLWRCLCTWASRRASSAVILKGMRSCYLRQCRKYKCCRIGRKLCYPPAPNVRCVRAPCCRKMVCSPRCK